MCEKDECKRKFQAWKDVQKKYVPIGDAEHERFIKKFLKGEAKVIFDRHLSEKRQNERCISEMDIRDILLNGWVIERNFNNGKNSIVVLGYTSNYRPLHVVFIYLNTKTWLAITAYDPRTHMWKWNSSFDERICFEDNCKGECY